jgi:hypothetical protein
MKLDYFSYLPVGVDLISTCDEIIPLSSAAITSQLD